MRTVSIPPERIRALKRRVWNYYRKNGRHDLPWRKTHDPYRIVVSEVMLQQTQVQRVIPKYENFLKTFPTVKRLARASPREVLAHWQGLGYNRRALALHRMASEVVLHHGGMMPKERVVLERLPGIGVYTAGAVRVFAFGEPEVLVETNIRTVMLHELMPERTDVSDTELRHLVELTLDTRRPREWYWALMDLGAHLKRSGVRLNNRSKHYKKQPAFGGSDRQIRGAIIRALIQKGSMHEHALAAVVAFPKARVIRQVEALVREGMMRRKGKVVSL
jgi:A/G-specific adenine glycosylase